MLQAPFGSVRFAIVGEGQAPSFFAIDAQSGRITVARSVADDQALQYTVRPAFTHFSLSNL